jgi:uncharacterized protein YdbL (DUF1318 family)
MKTLLSTALVLLLATAALAASKEELQKRFKDRYPQLKSLKQSGTIGETSEGLVDFVKDKDAKASKLVDAENADRHELYELVAKETNVTPDDVAARNAKRNHDKLQPGEYYRGDDGKWTQKK